MRFSPRTRAVVLGVALLATLVAAFAPEEHVAAPSDRKAVVSPAARRAVSAEPQAEIPDIAIQRQTSDAPAADPFSPNAWLPPPPKPAKPAPPPPPTAPPFPYSYLGRVDDAGKASVLFGRGDKSVTVQAGDVIDGVWRIEKVADRSIELNYQPLGQRQSISAGSD